MLTHVNQHNQPTMVDVTDKRVTHRKATAEAIIQLPPEVMKHLDGKEIQTKKGPVFQTAIIAGTQALKRTSDLIPFCHPLCIENCKFTIQIKDLNRVSIQATVELHHKTGVEMEALTGASVAALTIYDMCKALSHEISISQIKLLQKRGGKNDFESE